MIGPQRRISTFLFPLLALCMSLALPSCQTLVQEQGNMLDPFKVARIQEGRTTRKEVLDLLGSPTIVNSFKPDRWIYLQDSRYDKFQAVNRVEIEFDRKGVVHYLERNFANEIWKPEQLSAAEKDRSFRYLRNLMENDIRDLTPNSPVANRHVPLVADPNQSFQNASRKPGFLERLFSRWKSTPAKPDTTFSPRDAGWWRGIWSSDPTASTDNAAKKSPDTDDDGQAHIPFPLPR
ncbi:MAG: outer membrane protein assembly factor BamE [Magnetococcales bacterium]|nr:outer membrane protein assembly factor BamE [Magnetococcales bacterium]